MFWSRSIRTWATVCNRTPIAQRLTRTTAIMAAKPPPFPVVVHPYRSHTMGSCGYEMGSTDAQNAIIFIGGLNDGPHTTPYIWDVARSLERAKDLSYSVFEIRMRSSFSGFGISNLASDVQDISALVEYLRSIGRQNIVLFGHSTGCQDCMEYSNYAKHGNAPVDGFILQAPVSDREGLDDFFPEWRKTLDVANKMIAEGKSDEIVPRKLVPNALGAPVTAYRLRSLFAKGGDDDYFSSDLDEEIINGFWRRYKKPVLVLHSEKDEYVPKHISQRELNKKYQAANPLVSPLSDLIPNTGHTVKGDDARKWLGERVAQFLATLA